MVLPLNRLVDDIEISGIRQFSEKVGIIPNIIPLTLGAPDFPTPDHIKTAAKAAIDNNITNYTPNAAFYLHAKRLLLISKRNTVLIMIPYLKWSLQLVRLRQFHLH
ncbi:hypothetical protein BTHER_04749 [Brochothrix thermosphacta DSM 20171 = FSL F6-1036]|nr:hypothetical protein BTHER_04749 [Brochothrix thermosphacta DSM 20171 = FSL F6-1036]